jgi:DNA-binding beta-propeller fold protein YncE
LREIGHLEVGGSPYGLATDPTSDLVWVTLTARNEVIGVDVHGDTPRIVATYPTVRQPDTVAVAPGSHDLWVAGTVDGVVQHIAR